MPVYREFRGISYIDFPSEYYLVDIETTGLNPQYDNIIEIGAIKYTKGSIAEQFQTLVQPPSSGSGMFIDDFIVQLTGITNEMLSDAPKTRIAIKNFAEFLGDGIIVGYNVSFDVNFLYDNYMKHLKRPLTNNFIDVLRLARRLCADLPSRDLDFVMSHFGIKADNRHRAIGDCIATELIYERLQREALKYHDTLQNFANTFKAYASKKQKQVTDEVLEEWKEQLYRCNSVKLMFKFLENQKFTASLLRMLAQHIGVTVRKNAGRNDIITELIYSIIDDRLKILSLQAGEEFDTDTPNT